MQNTFLSTNGSRTELGMIALIWSTSTKEKKGSGFGLHSMNTVLLLHSLLMGLLRSRSLLCLVLLQRLPIDCSVGLSEEDTWLSVVSLNQIPLWVGLVAIGGTSEHVFPSWVTFAMWSKGHHSNASPKGLLEKNSSSPHHF